VTRRWNSRLIIPTLLFAGIPLLFIANIAVFQLAKNVPDARSARTNTVLSFNTIRAASAIDEAIQDAERGQRGFLSRPVARHPAGGDARR
jgi:CHASE3 domain sensor protein